MIWMVLPMSVALSHARGQVLEVSYHSTCVGIDRVNVSSLYS